MRAHSLIAILLVAGWTIAAAGEDSPDIHRQRDLTTRWPVTQPAGLDQTVTDLPDPLEQMDASKITGADPYNLPWWTVDGGGGSSVDGTFALSGTIAQAETARISGGDFVLSGGFWSAAASQPLFTDDFESGTTDAWSAVVTGVPTSTWPAETWNR